MEDNVRTNIDGLGSDDAFLCKIPKTWSMTDIIDELDFIKVRLICSVKNSVSRIRWQAKDKEKIFIKDTYDKGLLSNI